MKKDVPHATPRLTWLTWRGRVVEGNKNENENKSKSKVKIKMKVKTEMEMKKKRKKTSRVCFSGPGSERVGDPTPVTPC